MAIKGLQDSESPFSAAVALTLAILYTLVYVAPIYLSPTTRPSPTISRDSTEVIRTRIRLVSTSCAICAVATLFILTTYAGQSVSEALHLMGWYPVGLAATAKPVLLTAVLFAGPLFERGVVDEGWRTWVAGRALRETVAGWTGWRNFVAGPVTEEVLFRSLIVPLLLLTPLSPAAVVLLAPLPFGVAHIHHAYERRLTHPSAPLVAIVAGSLFQFAYTTLFGWFASFVLVRTGSLVACCVCHSFCNWMGLPRVVGKVGQSDWVWREDAEQTAAETVLAGGVDGEANDRRERTGRWVKTGSDLSVAWTAAYYVLLVAGALGFWQLLWPLTESSSALADV